ncbi:probable LRR receptor-like serine/threonine-protein kinase At3g47570 [Cornus florida]|uniref:probable LRR receptor-like serine/threonine-protein kinase At3g47570 n=1 Tax=Cornus florida TaxID=4283 RepID=UPI002899A7F5|nr:probable LRR receptor-like serine/threonine-protein kinase At3g47570 [Cornus florida]
MHASFVTTTATSRLGGNETDRLALLAFKAKITNDPLQVMSLWNGSIHFCHWHGVTCGRRHRRVTILDLESQKLFGSISPHIGNLSFLRVLNLPNNSFEKEIPPQLGRLRRLQLLGLHNNSISGNIPANLSACSNLVGFILNYNKLVGPIPTELGYLSKLKFIYMNFNNLIGNIPRSFMNLSSLEELYAFGNNFSGGVPDALGQLTNLTAISLGANMLSGNIPPSIFNLSSLTALDISYNNQITGSLPRDIGITLPKLQILSLGSNNFTGSIPISISNLSELEIFQVNENNLVGKVPTMEGLRKIKYVNIIANHLGSGGVDDDLRFLYSLSNATNLIVLAADSNNFGGMLSQSVGNFSKKLNIFGVAYNSISGSIPVGFENLINLGWLNMWGNQFTGNIPIEIGKLQKLSILNLDSNNLSGNIPSSLGNLSVLTQLLLGYNELQGSIPLSIVNCQHLLVMALSNNNLSGTIPPQVFTLSSLSIILDLSRNHFTGSLPIEVGNLKNLGELDVSDNLLSGEIPSSIGSCVRLENLFMEGNSFHGSIPSSLSSLRGIQVLDVSHNNLSGTIPEFFEGFRLLQKLNLSYNDFEGVVPINGVFANATATSVLGNNKLCGGIPKLHLPRCNFREPTKKGSTHALILVIPIVLGILGLILVLCFLVFCWFKRNKERTSLFNSGRLVLEVSYQSLFRATNGFSESNLIGAGSFGSVYEGILDEYGKKIAVKVFNLLHQGASRSFIAECEALRNIRHRNLVKVLSACSSIDYQNNDFKALVYEFMVNGSLDEWLHRVPGEYEEQDEPNELSLLQRLNIAIDIACALDYLHHHCQTPIVHCDLKPSNVLLDDDMTAHVGDFGLARFLLEVDNKHSGNQTSSIGIKGSIGYMPPEYGMGSELSTSGDVYSYGILLLEMFTRKRPTDEMFSDGMNLHNYAEMAWPDRVAEIIDPVVLLQGEDGETSTSIINTRHQSHFSSYKIQDCLTSLFRIGIACSAESPPERLDIGVVVTKLHVIRDNLLKTDGGKRITIAV